MLVSAVVCPADSSMLPTASCTLFLLSWPLRVQSTFLCSVYIGNVSSWLSFHATYSWAIKRSPAAAPTSTPWCPSFWVSFLQLHGCSHPSAGGGSHLSSGAVKWNFEPSIFWPQDTPLVHSVSETPTQIWKPNLHLPAQSLGLELIPPHCIPIASVLDLDYTSAQCS